MISTPYTSWGSAGHQFGSPSSGLLKNLIDWTSRYQPQPFKDKHALLLSASPSMAGGNRGLWTPRMPLEHLGVRVYPDMFSLAQAHHAKSAWIEFLGAHSDPALNRVQE